VDCIREPSLGSCGPLHRRSFAISHFVRRLLRASYGMSHISLNLGVVVVVTISTQSSIVPSAFKIVIVQSFASILASTSSKTPRRRNRLPQWQRLHHVIDNTGNAVSSANAGSFSPPVTYLALPNSALRSSNSNVFRVTFAWQVQGRSFS
jgi:hypothetical protein